MKRRTLFAGMAATVPVLLSRPGAAETGGTVKTVTLVSKPDSVPAEQFIPALQAELGPIAARLPGLRGFIISGIVKAQPRTDVTVLQIGPFDAIIDAYYASLPDQQSAAASADGVALDAALARRIGTARRFVTRETVVVPLPAGPRPTLVGLTFVMKPAGVSEAEFRQEWIVTHGPMAKKAPFLRGFTVSERLSDGPVPGVAELVMDGPLAGFTESWVDDVESRALMVASPEAKQWYAHGAEIFGKIRTDLLIEHVLQPVTTG